MLPETVSSAGPWIPTYNPFKSGSVLLAAYLHGLNNLVLEIIKTTMGFTPFDSAFSFLGGIYGAATLAIVALLVLRDPVWRDKGSILTAPEPAPVDRALPYEPQTLIP